jgi:hypothetical protein
MKRKRSDKSSDESLEALNAAGDELVMDDKKTLVKLVGYVLNPEHEHGKHKAAYFKSIGFTLENHEELANQLKFSLAGAILREESQWGTHYELDIEINLPNNQDKRTIVTAWIRPKGTKEIRLVTVIPPK